jgi:hypothetical protein
VNVPDRCSPATHLFVAIPAYDGKTAIEHTLALAGAGVACGLVGLDVTFDAVPGCCYLDHARNMLATNFMRSDASDLLFIDADVGFPPAALVQIAKVPRPFVVGIYPRKCDETAFPVVFDTDEIWADADGLVSPISVPTGFTRINRAVFDAMPCEPYRDDGGREWLGYFHSGVRGGRYSGEDTRFAAEWIARGGKIHMIPDITFRHVGPKAWEGNWASWMKAQL